MPNFEARRNKIRRKLKSEEIDGLLVSDFTNVTYLTGFTGDDSYLLIHPRGEIILTDSRYTTQIGDECPGLEMVSRNSGVKMSEILDEVLTKLKLKVVGIEGASMTVAGFNRLDEKLEHVELKPTKDVVEQFRAIKDKDEINLIREAIDVAQRGMNVIRASLKGDQTEQQIAYNLEHEMRQFGSTGCSFSPIIGVGTNGALPHYRPGSRRIEEADFVLTDWGAFYNFYVSDLTRVMVTKKLTAKFEKIYGTVLAAQKAGIAAIRPGAKMEDVDAAARKVIEDAGFGKQFGHGLGHGIGLQVHEAPRLSKKEEEEMKAGMVVTVEPGIYFPDWGGVRIEDDVLVTKDGHEVLSTYGKELDDCIVPAA